MSNLKSYESVKALIFYENKILLLKKLGFLEKEYEIPGGRKNFGETDEEALKREILEETGLEINIIRVLNSWIWDLIPQGIHLNGKTYLCRAVTNNVKLSLDHSDYKWVQKEELLGLDIPIWFNDAVSKLAII